MKILCADDNEIICKLYDAILAQAGHQVRTVNDGQEAWDLLSADLGAFDLVILDYRMPGLNGLELVTKLKQFGYGGRIVVQSGYLTSEVERALKSLNVDRIIQKPIGLFAFLDIVSAMNPRGRPR